MKHTSKTLSDLGSLVSEAGIELKNPIVIKETDTYADVLANVEPDNDEPSIPIDPNDVDLSVLADLGQNYVAPYIESGDYEGAIGINITGSKIELITPDIRDRSPVGDDADYEMKVLLAAMRLNKRSDTLKKDFTRSIQRLCWHNTAGADLSKVVTYMCKMAAHLGLDFDVVLSHHTRFVPTNMMLVPVLKHNGGRLYVLLRVMPIDGNSSKALSVEAMRILHNSADATKARKDDEALKAASKLRREADDAERTLARNNMRAMNAMKEANKPIRL